MIGRIKRPSKKARPENRSFLFLFIGLFVLIAVLLLADYSGIFLGRSLLRGETITFSSVPPSVVISSADSVLGCDLQSSRDSVIYGGKVRFTWRCVSAERCLFDGKNGYGPINEDGVEVSPENTRRYILKCSSGDRTEVLAETVSVFEFVMREIKSDEDRSESSLPSSLILEDLPPIEEKTSR